MEDREEPGFSFLIFKGLSSGKIKYSVLSMSRPGLTRSHKEINLGDSSRGIQNEIDFLPRQ